MVKLKKLRYYKWILSEVVTFVALPPYQSADYLKGKTKNPISSKYF